MARHKDLSTAERNQVVQFMLQGCINGKPVRGKQLEASVKFNISRQTVSRYWRAAMHQQQIGEVIHSVSGKKTRKGKIRKPLDYVKFTSIHINQRADQRSIAKHMGVSKTTVHRWYVLHLLRSHTSALKPYLTADNMLLRIRFSLQSLELDRILNTLRFSNMRNTVHIDEKWFYITKGAHRYYLAPEEEDPYRSCKSKTFIGKIMFLCAVARPLIADNGDVLFDGKIGIFPFIDKYTTKRNSINRPKGTKVTKPIDSIDREVIKTCLINKVLPAIMQKWPQGASKDIIIQQDNAKPHIQDSDPEFRQAATQNGFNIKLVQQPPNSPDCNVLDLGFFKAIQSLQHQTACTTLDDLVKAVAEAFHNLSPSTLNKVFLTLQDCFIEILKVRGHNKYKVPHMGKDALIRNGQLPDNLQVPKALAEECIKFLIEAGQINGIVQLCTRLGIQERFGLVELFGSLGI